MLVFVTPVLVTSAPILPGLKGLELVVPGPTTPELFRFEPVRLELVMPGLVVAAVVMPMLVL
jgi:hypothetical protein